jgi:oligosaccharide repeat unit polymerase
MYNAWFTFKLGDSLGAYTTADLAGYVRNASVVLFLIMLTFHLGSEEHADRRLFFLQALVTVLFSLLSGGRGAVFMVLVPGIVLYLLMRRTDNAWIMRNLGLGLVVALVVFVGYSALKYPYIAESSPRFVWESLRDYSSGGVVAFCEWAASSPEYANGSNSLRLLHAVSSALGYDVKVQPLVYHWYAADFGVIYAVMVQGMLGFAYGITYRKVYSVRGDRFWLVLYALLAFPLFMQFFMDEYASMASMWLQMGVWLWLFLRSGAFIRFRSESVADSRAETPAHGGSL